MANRFSFMVPDVGTAVLQGGAQVRQVDRERLADQELRAKVGRDNQFRKLAGQAYSAPNPADQQQAIAQAAGVDPQGAAALGQNLGSAEDRRKQRLGVMATALTKLPAQQRPGIYQSMVPELRSLGLNVPDQYTPDIDDLAQSLAAVMSGQQAPSNLRYFQEMTRGLPQEDVEKARRVELGLDGRATSAGMSMQKVTGPDGREYAVVFDPRTGQPRPVSMEELFGGGGAPPQGSTPGAQAQPVAPQTPFAGLSPAEKAAQEAQAKADVELRTAPQIARETTQAKTGADRQAVFIDEGMSAADSLPVINRAIELLDSVPTGGLNAAKLAATNFFGVTGADEGELSNNMGKAVLSQLRATFGAAFTEREGARLSEIEAGFGKSPATNKRLMGQVKNIVERAARRGIEAARASGDEFSAREIERSMNARLGQPENASQPAATQPSQPSEVTATGPNGQKIVLRNGQWVPMQ
jgi:hypothetical protein